MVYRVEGSRVGTASPKWQQTLAVNDSFTLKAAIYYLLKKHFGKEYCYADLLDIFHKTTCQTVYSQLVDLITAPEGHVNLSKSSLESFYLPVACPMPLCEAPCPGTAPGFSLAGKSLANTWRRVDQTRPVEIQFLTLLRPDGSTTSSFLRFLEY